MHLLIIRFFVCMVINCFNTQYLLISKLFSKAICYPELKAFSGSLVDVFFIILVFLLILKIHKRDHAAGVMDGPWV